MSTITIFEDYSHPGNPHYRHINHVLNRIKTGASKELISKIRATGDKELKEKLPCILFSGYFTYRNAKSIQHHSGFICLDFDKFPDSEMLLTWKDTLEADNYTYAVFLSPSGNGLKCLVKIPPIIKNHRGYFDALKEYYDCPYFDKGCSDVSRICYESYDPYMTINHDSVVWDICKEYKSVTPVTNDLPIDEQKSVQILLRWWLKKYGIYSGQRNSNLFKLMAAFNDYGVSKENALSIAMTFEQGDFRLKEIENTVNSAYRKTDKFGTLRFSNNG